MGLGSIVGTGLFVSLGIAAGVAGEAILLALPLAALLALCNGLSSAQLAAAHPVSGGTYEYGYRLLSPTWGFSAGWMFLLAKSASAATAALGVAGALLLLLSAAGSGGGPEPWFGTDGAPSGRGLLDSTFLRVGIGVTTVAILTALVAGGIRRSNRFNLVVVGVTLVIFAVFLAVGLPRTLPELWEGMRAGMGDGTGLVGGTGGPGADGGRWVDGGLVALLHATALLFVAYTGYGRIATLGEEVKDPGRTIPQAIWITLGVVALLYLGVAAVALGTVGAESFARLTRDTAAPLQVVALTLEVPLLSLLLGVAAVTAMVGVLLNLILGLSRVALAMGRRRDLPTGLSRIHAESGSPRLAVAAVGGVILVLTLVGDVRATWSFSAFTVLVYYGITNLAALRLPEESRRYPRWVALVGLLGCGLLAFQVEAVYWAVGVGLLAGGLGGRWLARRGRGPGPA
jgi:basic amino acid/polyamine antiporter, APA family